VLGRRGLEFDPQAARAASLQRETAATFFDHSSDYGRISLLECTHRVTPYLLTVFQLSDERASLTYLRTLPLWANAGSPGALYCLLKAAPLLLCDSPRPQSACESSTRARKGAAGSQQDVSCLPTRKLAVNWLGGPTDTLPSFSCWLLACRTKHPSPPCSMARGAAPFRPGDSAVDTLLMRNLLSETAKLVGVSHCQQCSPIIYTPQRRGRFARRHHGPNLVLFFGLTEKMTPSLLSAVTSG